MYVCLCNAVTDKDIAEAVEQGATNFAEVQEATRASTGCGSCRQTTSIVMDQCLAARITHAA
ncbi:(2Fe-2S)-binding protein [Gammaproteobacteria bacterium]|nr:(2Fe-2S)-binding protein [Gammaproteobacteria bacterium]